MATSTYGLSMTGEPTQMARTPSVSEFNALRPAALAGLRVEQAVGLLWTEWQVRWSLACWADAPTQHGMRPIEAAGILLSHRTEPWWAVVSVWTGGLPDGLLSPWDSRDGVARRWSIGKTIGVSGREVPSAEWASTLTELISATRARVRFERDYSSNRLPLDEVLDSVPVEVVPDIEAARMLAALRS